jgi:PBSX family phage terminase large subunit
MGGLGRRQLASVRHADGTVNLWDGSIRSGKTTACNIAWLRFVQTAPPGHLAIIGKTLDTIGRNILSAIEQLHPAAIRWSKGSTTCRIMGRTVHLIGASDKTAEERVRGLTLAGAYIDEVTLLDELMFQTLLGRLSIDGARLFGTTNPDTPGHWLKRLYLNRYLRRELPGWRVWHFTMDDNPGLSGDYRARMRRELTGLWYRRMYLGEWVAAEGSVFAEWDPVKMVVPWDRLPQMTRLLGVGVDYGTTNPSTGLLLGLGVDARLYLVDEWRHDPAMGGRWTAQKQVASIVEWMSKPHLPDQGDNRQEPAIEWVIVDPSASPLQVEFTAQKVTRLAGADNRVAHGLQLMSSLLDTDRLKVSSRCPGFVLEAPGYSWDPDATLKGRDEVIKTADHSLDGARYAVASTHNAWRSAIRAA